MLRVYIYTCWLCMHLYIYDYKYVCMYICMFVCLFAISFTLSEPLALLYVYSVMHIYIPTYIHTMSYIQCHESIMLCMLCTYYVHAHVHIICECACSNARLCTLLCHDRPTKLFFHIHHATALPLPPVHQAHVQSKHNYACSTHWVTPAPHYPV